MLKRNPNNNRMYRYDFFSVALLPHAQVSVEFIIRGPIHVV